MTHLAPVATAACGGGDDDDGGSGAWSADTLTVDFATYNPLSLIIREQGWLEETLGSDVTVEWVQSAGSNKANELLRSGARLDPLLGRPARRVIDGPGDEPPVVPGADRLAEH